MYKKLLLVAFLSASLAILNSINFSGCNQNLVAPTGSVKFSRDVLPIFLQNCNYPSCHNSADKGGSVDLSSWSSIMYRGSDIGPLVIPYSAWWSNIILHINRDTSVAPSATPYMPKALAPYTNGEPLPQNLVKLIIQWINEGAQNDDGTVAFSNIRNKAFITNQGVDMIAVVNLDNNFLVRLVQIGNGGNTLVVPHHVTVDNQGNFFYPAMIVGGTIEKRDAYSYQQVGSLYLGTSPAEIFLMNDGNKGYVTNWDASPSGVRSIFKVNTQNMTVTDTISSPRMWATHGGRMTHDDKYFIAVSQLSEYVFVIRTSDNEIESEIPIDALVPPNGNGTGFFKPYAIDITPDDRYAFISCPQHNDVRVLDMQTRTIINTISTPQFPLMLHISPDGHWCYVPNRNSNTLTVMDVHDPPNTTIVKVIPNIGVQPHGVDFTQDGHYAYCTCESQAPGNPYVHHPLTGNKKPGTTALIDVWGGHVKVKNIEMASFPNGIDITPGRSN